MSEINDIETLVILLRGTNKKTAKYVAKRILEAEYTELYFFYSRLLDIAADPVRTLPVFTPIFRSINAYRQIYQIISKWFSIGNYDLTPVSKFLKN